MAEAKFQNWGTREEPLLAQARGGGGWRAENADV